MNLYEKFREKQIDLIEYCEQANKILWDSVNETIKSQGENPAYGIDLVESLKLEGDLSVITRTNGARKSVAETFGIDKDGLINSDVLCMALVYKTTPREEFLRIYRKFAGDQPSFRSLYKSKSRTIKTAVMRAGQAKEYLDCRTTSGPSHLNNEDFVATVVSPTNPSVKMLVVCDGIGGHEAGEVASEFTAKSLVKWFNAIDFANGMTNDISQQLEKQITSINDELNFQIPDAGTTLTCAIVGDSKTVVANVGDSRLYLLKNGNIELFTRDDSVVWEEYYDTNQMTLDELRFCRNNNMITNCIGRPLDLSVQINSIPNTSYDGLLLTTDGVTDILSSESICRIIKGTPQEQILDELLAEACYGTPDRLCEKLPIYPQMQRSSTRPGKDNATAAMYLKLKH